jgi:hypothetical protein
MQIATAANQNELFDLSWYVHISLFRGAWAVDMIVVSDE